MLPAARLVRMAAPQADLRPEERTPRTLDEPTAEFCPMHRVR